MAANSGIMVGLRMVSRLPFYAFCTAYAVAASVFADKDNPVPLAAWKFSGTPDIAQFHKGRVVIPCGYQGVLLQRTARSTSRR